jgi:hypothetical protein
MRDVNNADVVEADLMALPGYPWLPCPICKGTEGCAHSVPERARTAHPGLSAAPPPMRLFDGTPIFARGFGGIEI